MSRYLRALWVSLILIILPAAAFAQIDVSITVAPPPLPVYVQPVIPGNGYLWTPGYWAWGDDGYFWVPGTWVRPPRVGVLWTPGYWGWSDHFYRWHAGYWGPHIGFYGGVDYGFGYVGIGYRGGYWDHGEFNYNRSVNNINTTVIHNTYNETVINNTHITRVSYNGGSGGVMARPTPAEARAAAMPHGAPTSEQVSHQNAARANRALYASVNHGRPAIAATPRPGAFSGAGVVPARAAAGRGSPSGANHLAPRQNATRALPQRGAQAPQAARGPQRHGPNAAPRAPEARSARPPHGPSSVMPRGEPTHNAGRAQPEAHPPKAPQGGSEDHRDPGRDPQQRQ